MNSFVDYCNSALDFIVQFGRNGGFIKWNKDSKKFEAFKPDMKHAKIVADEAVEDNEVVVLSQLKNLLNVNDTEIEPGTTAEIPLTTKDKEAVFLNFFAKKIPTNDNGEPDDNQEPERITGFLRILNYNDEPKINDIEYSTENNNEGLNVELDLNDNDIILKITAETIERIYIKIHVVSAL